MEFDKSRVFTAVNADELRAGDKVIVADDLDTLRHCVIGDDSVDILQKVQGEEHTYRFIIQTDSGTEPFTLAYLVERKANCTNCGASPCGYRANHDVEDNKINKCPLWFQPKTEPKAEKKCEDCTIDEICVEGKKIYKDAPCPYHRAKKHYRPFKDTDELIKVWEQKWSEKTNGQKWHDCKLNMPHIWVQYKMNQCGQMGILITKYEKNYVQIAEDMIAMHALMADYEFLDGSVCGVEA